MIKNITDLKSEELKGKKVIVRVDFNVPISNGEVANAYRIERAMPTIEFLINSGAKLLLISHIETKDVAKPTLMPVYEFIKFRFINLKINFLSSCFDNLSIKKIEEMKDGEIILFENIRQYEEEKKNDEAFAKSLASLGEIFVNDAFAVSHREHASVVGIPKFLPSYAGILLGEEIKHLNITDEISRPFIFILGGAKFETKLPLIQKFLSKADHVFIGGALINDILKAKGFNVGKSLIATEEIDLTEIINSPKLILPVDVVIKDDSEDKVKLIEQVGDEDVIVDIGPESINYLGSYLRNSKYILWNGPMGNFEIGFKDGTLHLGEIIGGLSTKSVVGGGDTLSAIQELNLLDKFTFVSTGGGAMLDYLVKGTLVGIEALDR
jgi:phosphoglycerate kinase